MEAPTADDMMSLSECAAHTSNVPPQWLGYLCKPKSSLQNRMSCYACINLHWYILYIELLKFAASAALLAEQQRQAAAAFPSASGLVYSRMRASEMADELGADEVVLPGPLLCIDRSICSQETHASDSVTCDHKSARELELDTAPRAHNVIAGRNCSLSAAAASKEAAIFPWSCVADATQAKDTRHSQVDGDRGIHAFESGVGLECRGAQRGAVFRRRCQVGGDISTHIGIQHGQCSRQTAGNGLTKSRRSRGGAPPAASRQQIVPATSWHILD